MNRIIRHIVIVAFVLTGAVRLFAEQDSTVQWKLSVQDLDRRLAALSPDNVSDIQAWRTDAEDLRTSLASFAAAYPEMQIEIPEPLPEHPSTNS